MEPNDAEVFAPTEKGRQHLKAGETSLSAADLQLPVLVDGVSSVALIAKLLPAPDRGALDAALRKLAADGLIISSTEETDKGVSALTEEGYYMSIARRATVRERKKGWRPLVLVVDEDPDLQRLLKMHLSLEGFSIRSAVKLDEILRGLSKDPAPDLVLLDVHLPDTNGFEVLDRMRADPALKDIPVIILTVESTREAVLTGLRGGVSGYLTRPFEPDVLTRAVRTVLGLPSPD